MILIINQFMILEKKKYILSVIIILTSMNAPHVFLSKLSAACHMSGKNYCGFTRFY